MKKLALIIAMLLVVPCAAFGMEMLNDSAMDEVTGQTCVAIAFDDVELFLNIDTIAWVDEDGISNTGATGNSGGAVGIQNFQMDTIKINAIVGSAGGNLVSTLNSTALQYDYTGTNAVAGFKNKNAGDLACQALTIDVTDTLPALSQGVAFNAGSPVIVDGARVGGVFIGLPTMEISIPSMSMEPIFWAAAGGVVDYAGADLTVANNGDSYGRLDILGITFTVLDGWMEIAPH